MAVVPVFVSSTFRDFHGERDILAGPVRERLDELVAPLGMRVELIDLRWGVNAVLGGQLRESDPTGRLTFSHSIVRSAAANRSPEDTHAPIVRVLDADNTCDSTDALDVVRHAIHSGEAESAAPLPHALNQYWFGRCHRPTRLAVRSNGSLSLESIAQTRFWTMRQRPTGSLRSVEPRRRDSDGARI